MFSNLADGLVRVRCYQKEDDVDFTSESERADWVQKKLEGMNAFTPDIYSVQTRGHDGRFQKELFRGMVEDGGLF